MAPDPKPPTQPEGTPSEAAHPRTAVRWMVALVLGVGMAAFMADRDSRNRATIEQAVERTAVGDRVFFPLQGGPTLLFESAPLVLAEAPEPRPESTMILAGAVDGLPYKLYIPLERVDANGTATWWVKTGPGLFLKVSRQ
jgi:hypothetical protein